MSRTHEQPESGERGCVSAGAVYEKPTFHRIGADEAETGITFGPEILILLS